MKNEIQEALEAAEVVLLNPELDLDAFPESAQAGMVIDILDNRNVTDYHTGNRYGPKKAKVSFGVYLCTEFARKDLTVKEYVAAIIDDIRKTSPTPIYFICGFPFDCGFCMGVLMK